MTSVTYTAKNRLTAGHVEGTEYTIALRCADIAPAKDVAKEASAAMSGNTETVIWRNADTWQITTGALVGGELEVVWEFLESVIDGETFQFDEFGRVGSPHAPVTVLMDGVYRRIRAVRQGDGGQDDYFRFTFSIRQVP